MKKDLNYYKNNAEEDYLTTPISVLRYITELEEANQKLATNDGSASVSDLLNNRLQWMLDEMDKLPPFKQSFNNLNERHGKLLSAKKILECEGLL